MRRILIERARRKQRKVHGGGRHRLDLDPDLVSIPSEDENLLSLDAALATLAEHDPVKAKLVELRFLSVPRIERKLVNLNLFFEGFFHEATVGSHSSNALPFWLIEPTARPFAANQ